MKLLIFLSGIAHDDVNIDVFGGSVVGGGEVNIDSLLDKTHFAMSFFEQVSVLWTPFIDALTFEAIDGLPAMLVCELGDETEDDSEELALLGDFEV